MTNSEIFKAAHSIARDNVHLVGDYVIAFSLALRQVYNNIKNSRNDMTSKLKSIGLQVWGDVHGKSRIYIKPSVFSKVFGLDIQCYYTGNIKRAYLNGEKISNIKARKILQSKVYYDLNTQKFVGTSLSAIL